MASVTRAEVARTAKDALPLYTQAKGGRCRPMRQGLTAYGVGGEMAFRVGLEPTPIGLTGRRSYQLSYRNKGAA